MNEVEQRKPMWARGNRKALYTHGLGAQLIRDIVLVAVSTFVILTVLTLNSQSTRIQEGRRVGTGFTCAALSAVSLAGRAVITSSAAGRETPLTRFLERHGYPGPKKRAAQSAMLGDRYTATILAAVERQIGRKGAGLVLPDGSIDCVKLARLAQVAPQ